MIAEPAASRGPKADETVIRQPFRARNTEELTTLLSAVATAILGFMIITTLYFGREILVPIALAILLSFVLAPLVGLLQRVRVPRGLAVVSVVIIAFALIFAMGRRPAEQARGNPTPGRTQPAREDQRAT
jgi:Na+-translocating ferredoxin:NAD+ oxidoreductase RnfD subunit